MDAWNLTISNPWSPGVLIVTGILLGWLGTVTLSAIITHALQVKHGVKTDDRGNTLFAILMPGVFLAVLFSILGYPVLVGQQDDNARTHRILEQIQDHGFSHVNMSSVEASDNYTFTASEDGKYVSGQVFETTDNEHYIVVLGK